MIACRCCGSTDILPLWADGGGNNWHRCLLCGSDSSDGVYPDSIYDGSYLDLALQNTGGFENAKEQVRSNIDWFGHYKGECGGNDFLDIGCLEGAAMSLAADRGWGVHGWDRIKEAERPGCTTITPYFAASFFPQMYHAVLCREVIEHVPDWRRFLSEIVAVTYRGGLVQIQTPRPWKEPHGIPYQPAHLQLFSHSFLELELFRSGFRVLDRKIWDMGQALLLKLVDKP